MLVKMEVMARSKTWETGETQQEGQEITGGKEDVDTISLCPTLFIHSMTDSGTRIWHRKQE